MLSASFFHVQPTTTGGFGRRAVAKVEPKRRKTDEDWSWSKNDWHDSADKKVKGSTWTPPGKSKGKGKDKGQEKGKGKGKDGKSKDGKSKDSKSKKKKEPKPEIPGAHPRAKLAHNLTSNEREADTFLNSDFAPRRRSRDIIQRPIWPKDC
jgi:hypothetical protein